MMGVVAPNETAASNAGTIPRAMEAGPRRSTDRLYLTAWPGLLRVLTHGTFLLEALGPLLVFIPWAQARWRFLAAALFIPFHATLAATMYLGFFPFVSIAGWLAFLPASLWSQPVEFPRVLRSHA